MYQNTGMQEVIQMCSNFEPNKSTKGASKLRRDLINGEIANLRDLLPLPSSTRQRLSQLQLMALVCVYVRKANYFQQVFKRYHELGYPYITPNIGFSKALSGFLIMMTQNGKLLYISDNAAEYLGHSMEDLLIHGDSVYDIIDKADHGTVQSELLRNCSPTSNSTGDETRLFLCRMNVSRNARRQMRFGDQKVVLLQGHYLSYLPLCSRNEPVFVATCTPVAMPETRECVVQGATNIFTTIHSMEMKFMHIDRNGEYYLGYTRSELGGISWYHLIHWNYMREAQSKHRLISQSEQEKSCILLLRMQTRHGTWIWVHCVLQVKESTDSSSSSSSSANGNQSVPQQSIIVATNQVLSEREAGVMRANAWIYHYYTVQTKLQYGLTYPDGSPAGNVVGSPQAAVAARLMAAAAYFPTHQQLVNYSTMNPPSPHSQSQTVAHHHQVSPEASSTAGSYETPPPPPHYVSPNSSGHPYSYHYRSPYEMSSSVGHTSNPCPNVGTKKESPLDFSIGAPPFDFHLGGTGYTPGSSYWGPSHHQSSGYTTKPSDGSPLPQTWNSHSQSTPRTTPLSNPTLPTHQSPTMTLRSSGGRKRNKRQLVVESTPARTPSPSIDEGILARRLYGTSAGDFGVGSHDPSVMATMTSVFPFHARTRVLYKGSGSSDDDSGISSIKDESLGILGACPLTPSPIWEGQRVSDFHLFGDGTTTFPGGGGGNNGTDLVHCIPPPLPPPPFQSYLPFCQPSVVTTNPTNNGPTYGFGYYSSGGCGMTMNTNCNNGLGTGTIMLETGSPNKENRLPPTPESSDHDGENEENRPLKWESL